MGDQGSKKRKVSLSKHNLRRKAWVLKVTGERPTGEQMARELRAIASRTQSNLENWDKTWVGEDFTLFFKKPTTGRTAYSCMKVILQNAFNDPRKYDPKNYDFDFVDDQRPDKPEVIGEEEASDEEEVSKGERTLVASGSASGASASAAALAAFDSASAAPAALSLSSAAHAASPSVFAAPAEFVLEERQVSIDLQSMRFKAMQCLVHPSPQSWLPSSAFQHDHGSHGSITFAFHKELGIDVAIKTIAHPASRKDEATASLVHVFSELECLLILQRHPCIVELLDVVPAPKHGMGLVFRRYGPSLQAMLADVQSNPQRKRKSAPLWKSGVLMPWAEYRIAFGGLVSAIGYLAGCRIVHADIKPANMVFEKAAAFDKLVLCDFGLSACLGEGTYFQWPRDLILARDSVDVTSLPYRAPELVFGEGCYTESIDIWSLGVVMLEVAQQCYMFRHCFSPSELRDELRGSADTRGDLSALKALPFGTEVDWKPHPPTMFSDRVSQHLGGNGQPMLSRMLALCPDRRASAAEILEMPFFSRRLPLMRWPDKQPGLDATVWQGDRGICQLAAGFLDPDLLAELQNDPYWEQDHQFSWDEEKGTRVKADRSRMGVEKAEQGSTAASLADAIVKMQIGGLSGTAGLRDSVNKLNCSAPCPVMALRAFIEAFRSCNARAWEFLDRRFRKGPLSKLGDSDLGSAGKELKVWKVPTMYSMQQRSGGFL